MELAPARGTTIAALSSGRPPAGIAVIRVSGPAAFAVAVQLAGPLPPARLLTLRAIRSGPGEALLDHGMIVIFPGPASATGEDIAEFHLHGGAAVVAGVIAAATAVAGVRLADPGEFTRRAFDNGRVDIAQAEGVADLIAAETASQRAQALALAGGALARAAEGLRARVLTLLAGAEAALDFGEDEADVADGLARGRGPDLAALADEIDALLIDAWRAQRIRDGLTVVVVGAPNAGKSSLVNALAMADAAIVSPVAGTTRDSIAVPLDLGGIAATLIDTAGLRDSDDPVEQEGVRRARARAARADLVLHLAEWPPDLPLGQVVISKTDLGTTVPAGALGVSVFDRSSVTALRLWLTEWAAAALRPGEPPLVTNARQAEAFAAARALIIEAAGTDDPVLAAAALRLAARAIGRVAGRVDVDDVLDQIFSRFCIGK